MSPHPSARRGRSRSAGCDGCRPGSGSSNGCDDWPQRRLVGDLLANRGQMPSPGICIALCRANNADVDTGTHDCSNSIFRRVAARRALRLVPGFGHDIDISLIGAVASIRLLQGAWAAPGKVMAEDQDHHGGTAQGGYHGPQVRRQLQLLCAGLRVCPDIDAPAGSLQSRPQRPHDRVVLLKVD